MEAGRNGVWKWKRKRNGGNKRRKETRRIESVGKGNEAGKRSR